MAAFARSVFHSSLAAALAISLVLRPGLAAAQLGPGESLIRDTEIENDIRTMATPIFRAAGLEPNDVGIYLVQGHRYLGGVPALVLAVAGFAAVLAPPSLHALSGERSAASPRPPGTRR